MGGYEIVVILDVGGCLLTSDLINKDRTPMIVGV